MSDFVTTQSDLRLSEAPIASWQTHLNFTESAPIYCLPLLYKIEYDNPFDI